MKLPNSLVRSLRRWNVPTISLLALLQRTPVVQVASMAEEYVLSSPIGAVLKSCAAVAASLGAMNSLAGATILSPTSGSSTGITVNAGQAVSVAFTVTPTDTPIKSWNITGSVAPGLNYSGKTSAGQVNAQNLLLQGTATTAGTYMVSLQAFDGLNNTGFSSVIYSYTVTVNGSADTAPSISTQPQSQTVNAGANVTFTVAATGSPTPTYQWRKDSTDIANETGASLTLNNVQTGAAGTYSVVVTNSAGNVTSQNATLTVNAVSTDTAPTISTQPQSQTVNAGANVTFTVAATGSPTPTYQWRKDSTNIANETGTTLTLNNVQAGAAGTYSVVVTNSAGNVTSQNATLTVNAVAAGGPATPSAFGAYASGATEATLTWLAPATGGTPTGYKIERATDSAFSAGLAATNLNTPSTSYVDTAVSAGNTYFYRVSAVNGSGTSAPTATAQVQTPSSNGSGKANFVNIATRAFCSTGNSVTIGGFVVTGTGTKRVLVRAVGPSLIAQGLGATEVLQDPVVEVHQGAPVIASNDNWGDNPNAADITTVAAQIGASALTGTDSKSAALLLTLNPGVYSFVVSGKNSTSGVVLLEVYDADSGGSTASFVNIATRAYSTTGGGVTIGGFVVTGSAPKNVLVRAVGPTLTTQGIGQADVLADPMIELHQGAPVIATNDNWSDNANAAAIVSTGARIGATPLDGSDSKSAAMLLKLMPGVYSFIAKGKSDTSGVVLVEVYDAD